MAWAHQWKMSSNPGSLKQAQEVQFSQKRNKLIFNGNPVKNALTKKKLGMFLDSKLDSDEQKGVFDKTSKSIGLTCKLQIFC